MGLKQMTSNIGSSIRKKNGWAGDESDEAEEFGGRKKRGRRGQSNGDSPPTREGGNRRSKSRKSVVFEDEDNLMRTKRSASRPGRDDEDDQFERE